MPVCMAGAIWTLLSVLSLSVHVLYFRLSCLFLSSVLSSLPFMFYVGVFWWVQILIMTKKIIWTDIGFTPFEVSNDANGMDTDVHTLYKQMCIHLYNKGLYIFYSANFILNRISFEIVYILNVVYRFYWSQ